MAVTANDLVVNGSKVLPGYNNNVFEYSSDNAESPTNSLVTISVGAINYEFEISPDSDNNFYFNTREIAKALLGDFVDGFDYSDGNDAIDPNKKIDFDISFKVNFPTAPQEELIFTGYSFLKAAKQHRENLSIDANMYDFVTRILSPIQEYIFWEGYPLSYSFFDGTNVTRYLKGNGLDVFTPPIQPSETRTDCFGVYLKWLNQYGGYNYWLFERVYQESERSRDFGVYERPEPVIQEDSDVLQLGKTTTQRMSIKTNFANKWYPLFQHLMRSPEVYLFKGNKDQENDIEAWQRVRTSGQLNYNSKRTTQDIDFDIILPSPINLMK